MRGTLFTWSPSNTVALSATVTFLLAVLRRIMVYLMRTIFFISSLDRKLYLGLRDSNIVRLIGIWWKRWCSSGRPSRLMGKRKSILKWQVNFTRELHTLIVITLRNETSRPIIILLERQPHWIRMWNPTLAATIIYKSEMALPHHFE